MSSLPPGLLLVLGAILLPFLPSRMGRRWCLLLPLLSYLHLYFFLPVGSTVQVTFFEYELTPIHVDRLSLVWGTVFHLAALVSALYAYRVQDTLQHFAGMVYAGAAIGAVFAGDLITLFINWELTAFVSVFLIWASRTERAYRAGMRYLLVQIGSGLLLLSGVLLHIRNTGSVSFLGAFHESLPVPPSDWLLGINSLDTFLIFLAFGVKAAFPLLHTWVTDAYPEATPTGTVFLSAFTTKLAIYVLARGFPGTECLIWIGAIMTVFPIFFAIIEDDLRRLLAYSLTNQLGFMVVGVGLADFVGHPHIAEMALNGTAAHAVVHILYKGLLFMTIGAVLVTSGTCRCSELKGHSRRMPWTAAFCLLATASIVAVPFFSGFVTKSMIMTAAAESHLGLIWGLLLFAAAAAVLPDLKVPYYAFYAQPQEETAEEASGNMLIAMAIAAGVSMLIGIFPGLLYARLPYEVDYLPYTFTHIVTQLQLLSGAVLVFVLGMRFGLLPVALPGINLDSDWLLRWPFVRRPAGSTAAGLSSWIAGRWHAASQGAAAVLELGLEWLARVFRPGGNLARSASVSAMVAWAAILLTAYLLMYYASV